MRVGKKTPQKQTVLVLFLTEKNTKHNAMKQKKKNFLSFFKARKAFRVYTRIQCVHDIYL